MPDIRDIFLPLCVVTLIKLTIKTFFSANLFFCQLGLKGDVALRRKNGALFIDGAFIQADAYKAGFVFLRVCSIVEK